MYNEIYGVDNLIALTSDKEVIYILGARNIFTKRQ